MHFFPLESFGHKVVVEKKAILARQDTPSEANADEDSPLALVLRSLQELPKKMDTCFVCGAPVRLPPDAPKVPEPSSLKPCLCGRQACFMFLLP